MNNHIYKYERSRLRAWNTLDSTIAGQLFPQAWVFFSVGIWEHWIRTEISDRLTRKQIRDWNKSKITMTFIIDDTRYVDET